MVGDGKGPTAVGNSIPDDIDKIHADEQEAFRKIAEENMARRQAQSRWVDAILVPEAASKTGTLPPKNLKPVPIEVFLGLTDPTASLKTAEAPKARKRGRPSEPSLVLRRRNMAVKAAVELKIQEDERSGRKRTKEKLYEEVCAELSGVFSITPDIAAKALATDKGLGHRRGPRARLVQFLEHFKAQLTDQNNRKRNRKKR